MGPFLRSASLPPPSPPSSWKWDPHGGGAPALPPGELMTWGIKDLSDRSRERPIPMSQLRVE
eukprot:10533729-Alexandrium_andersonii.AAC.1